MTFFFDIENFTDRIMVALTTLLVVATITSSIQAGLPKTSYYKMIDWWLLIALNLMVITMGFHTYMAYHISKCKNEALGLLGGSRIFSARTKTSVEGNGKDTLQSAKRINLIAKIVFAVSILAFNFIFWYIALEEYFHSAEYYFD